MKATILAAAAGFALLSAPVLAQDEDEGGGGSEDAGELIVTGSLRQNSLSASPMSIGVVSPPVIGLKRQADSAVRTIEIVSDSREAGMRQREVQAMLLAAIDRAKASGLFLVTGQFQLVEVTRDNWKDQFPGLAGKPDTASEEDEDDYEDEAEEREVAFEDDGDTATIRLKLKTKLDGSLGGAHEKIARFIKSVPLSGRAQIHQKGGLALTIINPAQYRDKIYSLVAEGAKHAQSFYGPDYGVEVSGIDQDIAWKQVSNTEVFLYLPYRFIVRRN
jgi:hypothetical protein